MKLLAFCFIFIFSYLSFAQNKPCPFDKNSLLFSGTPKTQALCLLRPNGIGGVLGKPLQKLPTPLEKLIGNSVKISKEKLRKYLQFQQIPDGLVGGDLENPLVTAKLPNGNEIPALYFIIHDTSSPYLSDAPEFPSNINELSFRGNILENWIKNPVAHIFVNRLGDSITATPFEEPVRSRWGTKFAREFLKEEAKGLQIHIELIQPRRRDPKGSPKNDLIAPKEGFTVQQYKRLALLYICVSIRRGNWLIPAYHSAIDAGIKDAHDDPQNFDLNRFAKELENLIKEIN